MHRRSDEELFVAYRRHRDTDALGVLFRRRVEELLRLAVFLAERPSDAEDLVQATFLSAISRAETFHEGSRVMSWLCGILTNHARMLRRAERRRLADLGAADSDPAPQPIHAALRAEVRQALDQGIGNLPEPYRSVLTLYLREGLDSREISRRLARPRATVRKQMERALDRLRTALPIGLATALVARMNPAQLALRAADAARFVEPCEPLADGPPADDGAVGAPRSSALPIALAGLLVLALVAATFPFHGSTAAAPVPADEVASAPGQGVAITVGTALAPVGVAADPTRAAADPAAELLVEAVGCDGAPRPGIVVLLA
ncbi:MAG: RNA polymerase sigma factor, partial [Planctomycetes bacterium]|nr:RNA polymerase sigma factor [Planctomycetota bacterium]